MEAMELSLDDYIKSKKPAAHPKKVNGKPGFRPRTNSHPPPAAERRPVITDARSKIIQKKRAKITDVRDLISAKKKPADARYVITKNMTERLGKMAPPGAGGRHPAMSLRAPMLPDPYMLDTMALDDMIPMKYSPRKAYPGPHYPARRSYPDMDLLEPIPHRRSYVDYDAVEDTKPLKGREIPEYDLLFKDYISSKSGGAAAAPVSSSRYKAQEEDVFDLYEAPSRDRRPLPPPPSSSSSGRRFIPHEETHLSYEMRSRLEGSQSAPKSMGIFANPSKSSSGSHSGSSSSSKGYRVMVTNLHSSVTIWDIQELFGDIGGLLSAEIVKPGVAEVVYKTIKDAEDAVEVYHNRQLDGQPMKCHLITMPPAVTHSSSSSSRRPPLELDLDTLHSALFTKKRH